MQEQKMITVDKEEISSLLLIAPLFIPRAFLLIVIIVITGAAHVLVPAHSHSVLVVLITINLSIFFLSFSDPCCKFIFVCCCHHLWCHLHDKVAS